MSQSELTASVDPLTRAVDDLLARAVAAAVGPAHADTLTVARTRIAEPLRLAIAGKVKAGKSTLLNALVGEELAPTDAGECTRVVTWYRGSDRASVVVQPRHGAPEARPYDRSAGALEIDLGGRRGEDLDRIIVDWPSRRLRDLTLIDTPGLASLSADLSAQTLGALTTDDDQPAEADAVLYLLRHAHASDVKFLEAFNDDDMAHATPLNAVAVLSRADEIGAARLDALRVAARVSDRYAADRRLRRLCSNVVPVAGLLGQAGTTLHEAEFRALATLTREPRAATTAALLTADRFVQADWSTVTELERRHLIARLGLFGVRLSVDLIRTKAVKNSTELAGALVQRSGLTGLRSLLRTQFTGRSRILKARSALASLRGVLDAGGCKDSDVLRASAEEIVAGAHAFVEVRALNQLRGSSLGLAEEQERELERVLGASGHATRLRLGLPPSATAEDCRDAALAALSRWRLVAEHPLTTRSGQLVARVACRSLEGMLAAVGAAG